MTPEHTQAPDRTPAAVQDVLEPIRAWLDDHPTAATVLGPTLLIVACAVGYFVGRRLLLAAVRRVTAKTRTEWDDILFESRFLHWLSYLIPLAFVYWSVDGLRGIPDAVAYGIERLSLALMVVSLMVGIAALLDGAHRIYATLRDARRRPIKGYVQLAKILVFITGTLIAGATLLDKDVGELFVGVGLSTAVVLLIFKDTILSLIASIQLTANDMVRVGDWIEMPQIGADGDVIEVALHTVKVQNFDKTISTIPTHKLYSESFKNWRGMQESGGRRIKRNLVIDVASIRFLTDDDIARLKKARLLHDYLDSKERDLTAFHSERGGSDRDFPANNRRLTNVGTFRAYILAYLRAHPAVHQSMTILVRQLQANQFGLPIELYLFTKTTAWSDYEDVQADIFDHLFAVVGEFDLHIAQQPTGRDLAQWTAVRTEEKTT